MQSAFQSGLDNSHSASLELESQDEASEVK